MTLKELLSKMPPFETVAIRFIDDSIKIGSVWEFYTVDKNRDEYLCMEVYFLFPQMPLDLVETLNIQPKECALIVLDKEDSQ